MFVDFTRFSTHSQEILLPSSAIKAANFTAISEIFCSLAVDELPNNTISSGLAWLEPQLMHHQNLIEHFSISFTPHPLVKAFLEPFLVTSSLVC